MEKKREAKAQRKRDEKEVLAEESDCDYAPKDLDERILRPQLPKTMDEKQRNRRLIVVLEAANLDTVMTKKGIELVNCDEHQKFIYKMKKQLEDYRPDITH